MKKLFHPALLVLAAFGVAMLAPPCAFAQSGGATLYTTDPINLYGMKYRGSACPTGGCGVNDVVVVAGNTFLSLAANNTTPPPSVSWVGLGGGAIALQTNGVANPVQTSLNFVDGNGIHFSNNGGTITASQVPLFSILTFTCSACGTYELGYAVPPVSFTASYSSPPSSASISDGSTSLTLTAPFTAGSLGSYTAGATPQTFTLSAVGATTQTRTQTISGAPRTFGGVGAAGATGASAAGTAAVLAGASGTLASAGLNNQASYGPYSATGQKVYVLLVGSGHTFTSGGFAFPMGTPTVVAFTNQYGNVVTLFLYESLNVLNGNFTLQVAS